jgi:hypothetical protein
MLRRNETVLEKCQRCCVMVLEKCKKVLHIKKRILIFAETIKQIKL